MMIIELHIHPFFCPCCHLNSSLTFSFPLHPLPSAAELTLLSTDPSAHIHARHCQCFVKPSVGANKRDTMVTMSNVKCQRVTLASHKVNTINSLFFPLVCSHHKDLIPIISIPCCVFRPFLLLCGMTVVQF